MNADSRKLKDNSKSKFNVTSKLELQSKLNNRSLKESVNLGEHWEMLEAGGVEPGGTQLGEPLRAHHVAPPLVVE